MQSTLSFFSLSFFLLSYLVVVLVVFFKSEELPLEGGRAQSALGLERRIGASTERDGQLGAHAVVNVPVGSVEGQTDGVGN